MNARDLEWEYNRLHRSGDVLGLLALADLIPSDLPNAASLLNCVGHAIGVLTERREDLLRAVDALEQAAVLAASQGRLAAGGGTLLRAKIYTNLAAFYVWLNHPSKAIESATIGCALPLSADNLWLRGLSHYHFGHAQALLSDFSLAEHHFLASLAHPIPTVARYQAHVALATLAARRGDSAQVDLHLAYVDKADELQGDPSQLATSHIGRQLRPHALAVRARLALVKGDSAVAEQLARRALEGLYAQKARPANWPAQLEVRWLVAEALEAQGKQGEALRMRTLVVALNGGYGYEARWGGVG